MNFDPQNPYGAPQAHAPRYHAPPTSGLAIASLVTGIISLLAGLAYCLPIIGCLAFLVGPPCGVAALVTGFLAQGQIKQRLATGKEMALAGLITGGLGIALPIVISLLFFVLVIVAEAAK